MARRSTGQVVERRTKRGVVYALRFYAAGERRYETLGTDSEGWNHRKAEDELAAVMAAVRAGAWAPRVAAPAPSDEREDPTFHEFASEWLAGLEDELSPKTIKDYRWSLSYHLLPFFSEHRVSAITPQEVDRYKAAKLAEGKLAPAQINKTLKRLAQILDVAIEYGITDRANPARGRRRRVKAAKPERTWVEPEQLMTLLEAAPKGHRPILATLAGAGLRIGEAVNLDWRDVNLATGILTVRESKTDAGTGREVDLPGGLLGDLKRHKADSERIGPNDPVFVTRGYGAEPERQAEDNVRRRLKTAITRANVELERTGIEPISERVSPHSLRRTYASLRGALRDDPIYVAEQLGHEDPTFTFRVYQRAIKRRDRLTGAYAAAYDRALEWALMGTGADPVRFPASTVTNGNTRAIRTGKP